MKDKLDPLSEDKTYLKGLGGWLILVAIGLILGLIRISYEFYHEFLPLMTDGTLAVLSNPYSEYYIPNFSTIVYAELGLNIGLIMLSLCLLFLFFYKHRFFPKLYIITAIMTPLLFLADALIVAQVLPEIEAFDKETTTLLIRSVISAAIWIPYMLVSERVKRTFVNPEEPESIDTDSELAVENRSSY